MNYFIIGAGAAGISAAREIIKQREESDRIVVITDEPYPSYYRPGLIEYLSGGVEIEDIIIYNKKWYNQNGISLKTGETAVKVFPEDKRVITDKGDYSYDRLLIAGGALPLVPPLEGRNLKNVFVLRNAADAAAIRQAAKVSKRAVVIGGGLLGLEVAYNLMSSGLDVTVVEAKPRLLPRQLDEKAADLLADILRNKGLSFYLNAGVERFLGEESVKWVKLGNDTFIGAELVVISAGIKPDTSLAGGIRGISINNGIIVNKFMETPVDSIYAAGDTAEFKGSVYGLWTAAMQQGRIAGLNMKNRRTEFVEPAFPHKLKVVGVNVVSAGEPDFELKYKYKEESETYKYRKTVYDSQNNIIGLIEVGDFQDTGKMISAIK